MREDLSFLAFTVDSRSQEAGRFRVAASASPASSTPISSGPSAAGLNASSGRGSK